LIFFVVRALQRYLNFLSLTFDGRWQQFAFVAWFLCNFVVYIVGKLIPLLVVKVTMQNVDPADRLYWYSRGVVICGVSWITK
jgi:hypothetical protein